MYIIQLTYKKSITIVDQYLLEHRAYLEECYKKNYLIASGPKNPRTGGILLSQVNDQLLLDDIIKNDPFYIHDIAEYEIIEFSPVKYHPDFAPFIK
jgi:uncharacterized protein YciI